MSNFIYRPNIERFKTWSEMGRERYEQAKREGRVSRLTQVRCEICIRQLSEKVLTYSRKHFGKPLCFRCQETERLLSARP